MPPRIRISDLKVQIQALEKKMFWMLCTDIVLATVLLYLTFSSF